MMPDDRDAILDLVLQPHRSLPPFGFRVVLGILAGFGFTSSLCFWWLGAWPVIGFFGAEFLLVYIAFKVSYAGGRAYERVRLLPDVLTVERVHASGRREAFSLQPYWLRVEIESDSTQNDRLRLSSHGRSLTIGAFLPPEERAQVADVLRQGLARLRQAPVYSAP